MRVFWTKSSLPTKLGPHSVLVRNRQSWESWNLKERVRNNPRGNGDQAVLGYPADYSAISFERILLSSQVGPDSRQNGFGGPTFPECTQQHKKDINDTIWNEYMFPTYQIYCLPLNDTIKSCFPQEMVKSTIVECWCQQKMSVLKNKILVFAEAVRWSRLQLLFYAPCTKDCYPDWVMG